ncbi:MAG: Asp-tRNA(Asn)/Glu-tRNA(Gln) amidotransferase subunit GatA [Actinobacteria bacterium]|nr:Asp-tRNA(Asn)/Glu-tRNA(Gln) amidotransferase subunit GatA [Actinomycetota bacterium]
MEIIELTAVQLAQKIRSRELSSKEVVNYYAERIRSLDGEINAFITQSFDIALKQAEEVDKKIAKSEEVAPYAGVPIGIKDLIVTKGLRTTCASKILENFIPPYDGTVARKVKENGLPIMGKLNMDEFAMGSSNENSYFGPVKNPWDLQRVPGGSSGGSAAAVAAGEVPWALGSDTGGSIRQPASFCGIVGLKPTYGLVSRYGLVAFASSLDQIGPMTRNVEDAAALLEIIAGHDPFDATSLDVDLPKFTEEIKKDVKDLKIAVIKELSGEGIDEGILNCFNNTLKKLEDAGVIIEEISLPSTSYALSAYYLIAPAEASSNLARYDGVRYGYRIENAENMLELYMKSRSEGFGDEVKRRIMLGTYALSAGYYEAFYGKALKARRLIRQEYERAFETYDLLVSPTTPTVAFKLGEKVSDPLKMYLSDVCTVSANLAGLPSASVPCGLSEGFPVGFQIIGPALSDHLVLRLSKAVEDATQFELKPLKELKK